MPAARLSPLVARAVFPKDFVWGSATSSYQIEGAVDEGGRGESIWDRFAKTGSHIEDGSSGAVACDHYHRWRDDVRLMQELGHRAYRFSVAWPRIFPNGRRPLSERGVDFYARLVDGLLEAGIAPYATLYHWDLPQAMQDEGGWASRATAEAFAEYADVVSRSLGDRVKHWITHNEPWCASMVSYEKGHHAPGLRDGRAALAASHHLLLSHGLAVETIRGNSAGSEVGITLNLSPVAPASGDAADAEACRHYDGYMNRWFLDPLFRGEYPADMVRDYVAKEYLPREGLTFVRPHDLRTIAVPTDFLGINYYSRSIVRKGRVPIEPVVVVPESPRTEMGWEVYPEGMFETLMRVHLEYHPRKIYVTENGASYSDGPDAKGRVDDARRVTFMRDHLRAAHRCIASGVPLHGYFAWSLLDNYEWQHGYTQRFGVVWVDFVTQKRISKDSALWYRSVIADNAVE
jgi:beta-glucosidase